jgi:DNA-binding NarL/FixJ family response regulator
VSGVVQLVSGVVLLVEDEDDSRELLGLALSRAGYQCLLASDAAQALEHARAAPRIDVVVTDIVLAGDDRGGLDLLARLGSMNVSAPVIVVTAFADVEKVKRALNEGAAHFLEKPFTAQELLLTVERVSGKRTDLERAIERALSRAPLTEKERRVARHLLEGLSSSEIATVESNSPKTIRQHISQIYAKCGVGSRAELFRLVYLS